MSYSHHSDPVHGHLPDEAPSPQTRRRRRPPSFWLLVLGVPALVVAGCTVAVVYGAVGRQPAVVGSGVGSPVRDGELEFTVTKTQTAAQVGDDRLNKRARGEFVLVHVTVSNVGGEPQTFLGNAQKLFDNQGREYPADTEAAVYIEDARSLYERVNPGARMNGVIVFDLPKNAHPAYLELHDSLFSPGARVTLA